MCDQVIHPLSKEENKNMVANYVNTEEEWDWGQLDLLLPKNYLSKVASHLRLFLSLVDNRVCWRYTPNGRLSMNYAYQTLKKSKFRPLREHLT